MHQVKQIYLQLHQGEKISTISRNLGLSRNTIKAYRSRAHNTGLSYQEILLIPDEQLEAILQLESLARSDTQRLEELKGTFEHLSGELQKKGVTRWLLWQEYRRNEPKGYSYSQFCWHLQQYHKQRQVSSIEEHLAGDKLYIDFAGAKMHYIDPETGEIIYVPVFVAQLGFSKYSYIEAVPNEQSTAVIEALRHCLAYFGGVPRGLVPDNMKTAVTRADRYEPQFNATLSDFCNHYGMALMPARVRKPKDKALAEQLVNHFYQQVLAPLRNRQFYSLAELNTAILEKLEVYHTRHFQRKDYARKDLFMGKEKQALQALPAEEYELKKMRELTVRKNCFVELRENNNYYSVPHHYIGEKVRVIYTATRVEIYHRGKQIAVHRRSYKPSDYVLIKEHLPSHLQQWKDRSPEYYQNRALRYGPSVQRVISLLLEQTDHPEVKYNSCEGIFHLSRKSSPEKLERACTLALEMDMVSYSTIKRLVSSATLQQAVQDEPKSVNNHNGRGARYYLNLFSQHILSIIAL